MTAERRAVTVEGFLDRPPEVVFDFLADPRNEPLWCRSVTDVRIDGSDWEGTGSYTFVQLVGPLRRRERSAIVEAHRPQRLRWNFGAFGSRVDSTMELRADGRGTHLTQTNEVSCSRLQWFAQGRIARRELPIQISRLKAILEDET